MSDNQLIRYIRQRKELQKLWNALTTEQRRSVLAEADQDTWHIDEILENVTADVKG